MPALASGCAEVMLNRLEEGSKTGYVSSFRHWVNWNMEYDEDPFEFPIPPQKIQFWIQQRFEENGNINSLKTWTATINWICDIVGDPKEYKQDMDYKLYIRALKKQYTEAKDHRLPFRVHHIHNYVKSLMAQASKQELSLEEVTKATLAVCYFCTMSRPAELVKPEGSGKKLRGLKFQNYQRLFDEEHQMDLMELTVDLYKNQSSRLIKKKIYLSTTKCTKSRNCWCNEINPHRLIRQMLKMRKKLSLSLAQKLRATHESKSRLKLEKQIQRMTQDGNNYLFVHTSGKPFTYKDISKMAEDCAKVNGILDDNHYTPYSFRIGGTTRAHLAGIEHPMILKYVGWSASRLNDCAQRYMRFAPWQLAMIPFYMLHPKKAITQWGDTYDPWSERLNQKYYTNQ